MSKYKNFQELQDAIRKQASAGKPDREAIDGIKDPDLKGTVAPKDDKNGGDDKNVTMVPNADNKNENNSKAKDGTIPSPNLNPVQAEEDVPGTSSGNAKEEAAGSPTDPLSKIASLSEKLKNLNKGKTTEAPAKEASAKTEDKEKKAAKSDENLQRMELTPEFHIKLATEILKTEEGIAVAEGILRKSAGEEAARELLAAAGEQQYEFLKQAAEQEQYEQYLAEVEAQQAAEWEELTKNASEEEIQEIVRIKQAHTSLQNKLETDLEKQAYAGGADDAAMLEAAMAEEGGEGMEGIEEDPEMAAEEILMLIDEAVQSGEISEEDAMMLAESLLGGGDEGMDPEAMAMAEGAEKMASVLLKD